MHSDNSYSKPPIMESLLDIRHDPGSVTLDQLRKCQRSIGDEYTTESLLTQHEGRIEFGPQESSHTTKSKTTGYAWTSSDSKKVFNAQLGNFTFNWLSPYPGWKVFVSEAARLWNIYRKIAQPRGYSRIAVRYINRIDFPVTQIEMKDYFQIYLEVPNNFQQPLQGFFSQVQFNVTDRIIGVIRQLPILGPIESQASILLDIDVIRSESIVGDKLWEMFEELRLAKNNLFESCITDRIREMIK